MLYSIFVGRIPHQTTKEELVSLFNETAEVKEVYISIPEGSPFTYGFVRFGEVESVLKVMRVFQTWRLHDSDLTVEISHDTKRLMQSQTKKSAVVKSDLLARARIKEACHAINMELDLLSDAPRLNPKWVEERIDRHPNKRIFRMPATPVGGPISLTKEVYKMADDSGVSQGAVCKAFTAELKDLMAKLYACTAAKSEQLHGEILAALSQIRKEENLKSGDSHCPVRDSKSVSFLPQTCFGSEYEYADDAENKTQCDETNINSLNSDGSDVRRLCRGSGCDTASSRSGHRNSRSTSTEAVDTLADKKAPRLTGREILWNRNHIMLEGLAKIAKTMAPESKFRNRKENTDVYVKEYYLRIESLSVKENSLVGGHMPVTETPLEMVAGVKCKPVLHTSKLGPSFLGGGRGKVLQDLFGPFPKR